MHNWYSAVQEPGLVSLAASWKGGAWGPSLWLWQTGLTKPWSGEAPGEGQQGQYGSLACSSSGLTMMSSSTERMWAPVFLVGSLTLSKQEIKRAEGTLTCLIEQEVIFILETTLCILVGWLLQVSPYAKYDGEFKGEFANSQWTYNQVQNWGRRGSQK